MNWKTFITTWAAAALLWCAEEVAQGQFSPQQSYSDYFNKQVKTYHRPSVNPARTTYDRYFYNNPAVSPYSNLMRPSGAGGTSYQSYVLPEIKRRTAQAARTPTVGQRVPNTAVGVRPVADPFSSPTITRPATTGSKPNQYYNHWYGNRLQGR